MKLKAFKSFWGMTGTVEENLRRIREAGYEGVETGIPGLKPEEWKELLNRYGLDYICMIFPFSLEEFRDQLKRAVEYGPLFVNSHTGRDSMNADDAAKKFVAEALKIEQDAGIAVGHETHRGRIFYNPWDTAVLLEEFPALHLTLDLSHWVVVCERRLQDVEEKVRQAASRAIHLHARIGSEESPQVSDPRAPEYRGHRELFEAWWDVYFQTRREKGGEPVPFCPEYGPPIYLQALPYTRQPVADLWEICLWGAEEIRKRWAGED